MSAPNPVIGVDVRGVDQVIASLRALGQDITEQVELAVEATALEALTTVRKAIQGPPKTGREYPRGKNGNIIHRASAPGEAPATDTGALAAFTYITKVDPFTMAIGSGLAYAFYLEFGTRKMAKRPSWIPAAEKAAPRLQKRIERVIREATARAQKGTA